MNNLLNKARSRRADALAKLSAAPNSDISLSTSDRRAKAMLRNDPIPFISKRAQSQSPSWVH